MKAGEIFWDVVPYVTLAIVVVGTWWRYRYDKFGWTTRSSQLYESRLLRIGSPMFHFGILVVVFGHVIGLVIPQSWTERDRAEPARVPHPGGHARVDRRYQHAGWAFAADLPAAHHGPGVHGHHRERQADVRGAGRWRSSRDCAPPRSGPASSARSTTTGETVSVWFRSIWILQPRGDLMAAGAACTSRCT